jgi:hypothetical protein
MSNNNEHPNTPETNGIVARATAHRRIDAVCIAEMAKLVAKMLTESEACRRLGIRPRAWFDWKSRCGRSEKFGALLEAFRADRIDSLIAKIEAGADGVGLKAPDWRAAYCLLSIQDRHRFGPQAEAAPPPQVPQISVNVLLSLREKVYGIGADKPAGSVTAGPPRVLIGESSVPEPELKNITPGKP